MYLVLGATEMVGAHLVCTILNQGQTVRAIKCAHDNTNYTKQILSYYSEDYELLFNEIEWVEAEYDDLESLKKAMDGICTTFCCITPTFSSKRDISDNVDEIKNILSAVADSDSEYFCYMSSVNALGDEPEYKEITETSQRNPKGNYTKKSKAYYYCEMEVQRAMQEGLPAGIINAAAPIGPGDWKFDNSSFVNESFFKKYYTDGVTGLVGVNDLATCMMTMAKKRICNEKFIVCSQCLSCHDLILYLNAALKEEPPKRKASNLQINLYKLKYAIKSIMTGRRPIVDKTFFDHLTQFKLYSNEKSLNTLICSYKSIEESIATVCSIYLKHKDSNVVD